MKLIDKDALVAEIEKRIADNKKDIERASHKNLEDYFEGYEDALVLLKEKFLDTLEVKEVDSRLTLEDISVIRQIMFDYNSQVRNEMSIPNNEDYCKEVLKRFKAQNGEKI